MFLPGHLKRAYMVSTKLQQILREHYMQSIFFGLTISLGIIYFYRKTVRCQDDVTESENEKQPVQCHRLTSPV